MRLPGLSLNAGNQQHQLLRRNIICLLFLVTIISCHFETIAQAEFQEGFIVKQSGDTLWGYVNLAKKSVCHYKLQKSDKNHIVYQPGEINGFGFSDGRYFENRLIRDDQRGTESMVFMECLVRGDLTVYFFQNRYFVVKSDTAEYELFITKEQITSTETSGNKLFIGKKYIGILNYLMNDCPGFYENIRASKLTRRDLTELITEYNKCTGAPYIQYQEQAPWLTVKYSVYGGVIMSSMKFTSTQGDLLFGSPFESSGGLLGTSVYFSWPRTIDRASMTLGLFYFSTNFRMDNHLKYQNGSAYSEGGIRTNELKVPWGVYYTFSKKRFAPMIGGGLAGSIMLDYSTEFSWEVETQGVVQTRYYDLFHPDNFNYNFWLSAGARYELKKGIDAMLEFRYDGPSNISESYSMKTKYTHFSIVTGIRFK